MYRRTEVLPSDPKMYELPFEGKLSAENRWVIMANLIPWEKFEEEYAKNFSDCLVFGIESVRINYPP